MKLFLANSHQTQLADTNKKLMALPNFTQADINNLMKAAKA